LFYHAGCPITSGTVLGGKVSLNQHYFATLHEAKKIIEDWRLEYNTFRPHGSLNGLTPEEFRKDWEEQKQQKAPNSQLTSCTV
jgi:transposase InsO family protein